MNLSMGIFTQLSNLDNKTTFKNTLGSLGQGCFEINRRFKHVIENKITLKQAVFTLQTLWLANIIARKSIELS